MGDVRCNSSGCTTEYKLFFEFYPYPATICDANPPYNAGDDISARVTNDKKYGGSNTSYDIVIHDYTTGNGCATFNYNFHMSFPKYANFIYERPAEGSGTNLVTLPKFTDNTMRGWLYYDNTQKSIQTPYDNDWRIKLDMNNNQGNNINIDPASSGQFTADYKHSKGT
ncbi:MAG: hypothetical protein D6752_07250 [Candidatus Nitrosothermus koennekii]|nr:MAG: hypothetical protein D6752_07250 [Candidatus Nitrosothermus koennekii]